MPTLTGPQKQSVTFGTRIAIESAKARLRSLSTFEEVEEELEAMRGKLKLLREKSGSFKTDLEIEALNTKIDVFEEKRSEMLRSGSWKTD